MDTERQLKGRAGRVHEDAKGLGKSMSWED